MIRRADMSGTVFRGLVAAFLVFLLILSVSEVSGAASEDCFSPRVLRYESVRLTRGDTLERIALRYNDRSMATDEEYISELKALNRMRDDHLRPGCYLSVMRFPETRK